MYCSNCGTQNPKGVRVCQECGTPLATPAVMQPALSPEVESSAMTAAILEGVFGLFGVLGIGNMYANRTSLGFIYLIGWWIFLFVELLSMAVLVGFCLTPLNIVVPLLSAIQVRGHIRTTQQTGSGANLGKAVGIGCGALIVLAGILFVLVTMVGLGARILEALQ